MGANIKIIVILGHIAFLLIYGALIAMLMWHYRKYSLPHDSARWIWGLFLSFALIFGLIATILVFLVPWNKILNL